MPEHSMNVLSLFSGIPVGGLELGLERAGLTIVGQVEIDPYCQRVLAKHWPEVPKHDDVRTCADWWESEPRPRVDLIAGGFPCQDVSNAGRRAGIVEGTRSSLWSYMAATVRALRPRYVLVENVAALLARGLDVVLADLAACGYDAEWDCIPAAAVGAPHRRDRVWLVAYPQRDTVRVEPVPVFRCRGPAVAGSDGTPQPVADAIGEPRGSRWVGDAVEGPGGRDAGRGSIGPYVLADAERVAGATQVARRVFADAPASQRVGRVDGRGWSGGGQWAVEPDVGRVAHGVPARVDRLRGLGNAVVPQVAEHVGRLILAHDQEVAS